jgi:hypothetical protein
MPMVLRFRVVVAEQFFLDSSNYDFLAISSFEKPAPIGLGGPVVIIYSSFTLGSISGFTFFSFFGVLYEMMES